jgi:hypothetical protein
MKLGFEQGQHAQLIPANYDFIYNVGMIGNVRLPTFQDKWNSLPPQKRGIIHQPVLSVENDVNDNASAFLWLCQDQQYNGWNNGVPLLIDIWYAYGDARYNLDHIRQYGMYITEHFKPVLKPLIRLNLATWTAFVNSNMTEALRITNDFDLLLVQTGVTEPSTMLQYGVPQWWEYEVGKFAYDETGFWNDSPVQPAPIEEPEQPPEEEPVEELPVVIGEQTVIRKWTISLLGGLIKGTITAEEEK